MLTNTNLVEMHKLDSLWCNKNICLKTIFFLSVWYDKGIRTVQDVIRDNNRFKEFFELVLEFDIPIPDKRKYSSLIKAIPLYRMWSNDDRNPYDLLKGKLLSANNLSKFAYSVFIEPLLPYERCRKWNYIFGIDLSVEEWSLIHKNNFKCTFIY